MVYPSRRPQAICCFSRRGWNIAWSPSRDQEIGSRLRSTLPTLDDPAWCVSFVEPYYLSPCHSSYLLRFAEYGDKTRAGFSGGFSLRRVFSPPNHWFPRASEKRD